MTQSEGRGCRHCAACLQAMWAWLQALCSIAALFLARLCEIATALLQLVWLRPPAPQEILRCAPPRSVQQQLGAYIQLPGGRRFATAPLSDALVAAVERQLASGTQVGMAVAVYWHGQLVAHICGGVYRAAGTGWGAEWRPVQPDTLFMGFSVVKGVAATCLLTAVDRGEVSYQHPVASVWPGFAGSGKLHVSVADAVSHRAGLSNPSSRAILSQLLASDGEGLAGVDHGVGGGRSWTEGIKSIEEATPRPCLLAALAGIGDNDEPALQRGCVMAEGAGRGKGGGSTAAYHYVTFSWILGGIVEGASGMSLKNVIDSRICSPLGLHPDALHIGCLPPRYSVCLLY